MLNMFGAKFKEITIDQFILDPCKATPGFEFFPKFTKKIDLEKLLNKFKLKKIFIEKESIPFFITIKHKDSEVTIFSSLKIIIKNINEEDSATQILKFILCIINDVILQR
jgi:ArsR family metal-binding transcriptional regulator